MKPWLYVGAKVIYLGGISLNVDRGEVRPVVDETYTVRDFLEGWNGAKRVLGVYLGEVVNAPRRYFDGSNGYVLTEMAWDAERFRPVSTIDTKTTVAALRRCAIDAVNNASGGLGIRKPVSAR